MFKSLIVIFVVSFATLFTLDTANAQTPRLGMSGHVINFSNGASTFRIDGVVPGSMAWKIGLREGDHVLNINGIKPRSQRHINMAVTAAGDGRVSVLVRRGSQVATLSNNRRNSAFDAWPTFAKSNFQQLKVIVKRKPGSEGAYLQISKIGRDGLGYKRGLRAGDVIVRMDGKRVTTLREYRNIVANASELRLLVQAPNGNKRRVLIR